VRFDIGHGRGSFSWRSARAALADDFPPDSISTDLHYYSVNGPAYDQLTMIAKFLHLGLSIPEVVALASTGPATLIGLGDTVSLRPGAVADVAAFRVLDDPVSLSDATGPETARQRLEAVLTVVGGRAIAPGSVPLTLRPSFEFDRAIAAP
jgi:dihydroorotase